MGLDMYAFKTKAQIENVDFADGCVPDAEQIASWRKHPNLHGFMEQLYRSKGGAAESFNLVPVKVATEDLDALEKLVNGDQLPVTSGFFFGESHADDKEDDLAFITGAREAIADGYSVFYSSWW